jgi:hypothetical protein
LSCSILGTEDYRKNFLRRISETGSGKRFDQRHSGDRPAEHPEHRRAPHLFPSLKVRELAYQPSSDIPGHMPDDPLTLRQTDQIRGNLYAIHDELDFIEVALNLTIARRVSQNPRRCLALRRVPATSKQEPAVLRGHKLDAKSQAKN